MGIHHPGRICGSAALEYFLQHLDTISRRLLKIFCYSQSTATLHQKGAEADISWTQGHASIVGNAIADALAKEAATDAKNQPECSRSTSIQEIKEAIKKTQLSKWQSRWDNTEYDRVCLYLKWTPRSFWISPVGRASAKSYKLRQNIQNLSTTDINWVNVTVMSAYARNPRHPNTFSSTVPTSNIAEKSCS